VTDPVRRHSGDPATGSPLVTMVLGTIGFAAGLTYALFVSNEGFRASTTGRAWMVLVGVNGAAWALLLIPIIQRTRAVEEIVQGRRGLLVLTVLYFAILFGAPLWPGVVPLIAKDITPTPADYVLPLVGGVVAGLAMVGIWRIHAATQDLRRGHGGQGATTQRRIALYMALQDHLQAFLWIVGAMISLGTLALGFAMKTLGAADEVVWAYGLYYTTLLALSYAPTYMGLVSAGRSLRDELTDDAPDGDAKLEGWLRRRHELDGLLRLSQGPLGNLKAGVFVVGPLLTSVLSTVFDKGG
jgi:hypothetical protein